MHQIANFLTPLSGARATSTCGARHHRRSGTVSPSTSQAIVSADAEAPRSVEIMRSPLVSLVLGWLASTAATIPLPNRESTSRPHSAVEVEPFQIYQDPAARNAGCCFMKSPMTGRLPIFVTPSPVPQACCEPAQRQQRR